MDEKRGERHEWEVFVQDGWMKREERHEWEVSVQDGWMKREERGMSGKCLYKMDG